ncbi:MAG: sugar ABC transporter substrate-binding protein [Hespellia sp.]|nr:sugar ABC transporter substrate-binding protein [Hespellia sp.]
MKMKKIIRTILAVVMVMCMLAACGGNKASSSGSTASADGPTIGVIIWSTDDGLGADAKTALDTVAADLGVNLIYRTGSFDADSQTTDIENLISAGAEGILICPIVDASNDEYLKTCEDADIPMQLMFRNIVDQDAYDYCMASDQFAGYVSEDEQSAAVAMVDKLLEEGCTTFGLVDRESGNAVIDRRQTGYKEYLDEKNITYYETITTNTATATEMVDATDQLLAANPDIDGIILSSGSNGAIDAIITDLEGKDIKLTSFDTPADIKAGFEGGNLCMLTTGAQIDPVYAMINLYNKMNDAPKADTPTELDSNYIYMTSVEDAQNYEKCFSEFNTYTADEVKELVDMDLDAFKTEMKNYSLEMVSEKMK